MMNNTLYATMLRNGKVTYFIDVKEARNGQKYIALTETEHGEPGTRKTVRVFAPAVDQFRQAIEETAAIVLEEPPRRPPAPSSGHPRRLYSIVHTHRHGTSHYLLESDHAPTQEETIRALALDYEPDKGEALDIDQVEPKTI